MSIWHNHVIDEATIFNAEKRKIVLPYDKRDKLLPSSVTIRKWTMISIRMQLARHEELQTLAYRRVGSISAEDKHVRKEVEK